MSYACAATVWALHVALRISSLSLQSASLSGCLAGAHSSTATLSPTEPAQAVPMNSNCQTVSFGP